MVGVDVVILVLIIPFWFRLGNKVGTVIGPGITKYYELKVIPERSPSVVYSYNILKRSCK